MELTLGERTMTPRAKMAAVLMVAGMVVAISGCGQAGTAADLPGQDPLCDVFPRERLAEMLPGGTYTFNTFPGTRTDHIFCSVDGNFSEGECSLANRSAKEGSLLVLVTYNRAKVGEPVEAVGEVLSAGCDHAGLENLVPPRVGQILATGSCDRGYSTGNYLSAWAL